ncbi:MAG: transposase [Gemmataceae bacterium]
MRGTVDEQPPLFHTFRPRTASGPTTRCGTSVTDRILAGMSDRFAAAYSRTDGRAFRPNVCLLLQCLYSIRSERQLCERIDTDLLFRWFWTCSLLTTPSTPPASARTARVSMSIFDAVVLRRGGGRGDDGRLAQRALQRRWHAHRESGECQKLPVEEQYGRRLRDSGDDSGDANGFKPRNAAADFRGQKRSNRTHRARPIQRQSSTASPAVRRPSSAHGDKLAENRHGLIVTVRATEASGKAERTAAVNMLPDLHATHGVKLHAGADKGFDDGEFFGCWNGSGSNRTCRW